MNNEYKKIINHYNNSFKKHGFNLKALNWRSLKDNNARFKTATEHINSHDKSILDFGCGTSLFFNFLKKKKIKIEYNGLDTNREVVEYCKKKFPKNKYYCFDIMNESKKYKNLKNDVVFANGIFTQKLTISNNNMYLFTFSLIKKLFKFSKKKIIFNILIDDVEWKNPKNFYVSINKILKFIKNEISDKIVLRLDYNKFECMIVVYK
jgi:SAM-dependent methyltransferase